MPRNVANNDLVLESFALPVTFPANMMSEATVNLLQMLKRAPLHFTLLLQPLIPLVTPENKPFFSAPLRLPIGAERIERGGVDDKVGRRAATSASSAALACTRSLEDQYLQQDRAKCCRLVRKLERVVRH